MPRPARRNEAIDERPRGRRRQLAALCVAELLAMTLWFSASAVVPQLELAWDLGPAGRAWMTMSVQLGFVLGALVIALLTLADRIPTPHLVAGSALVAAAANACIPLLDAPGPAIALRLLTGMALAGVYPPGMKLVTTWYRSGRGLAIGTLVGALALGSAGPHLFRALPALGAEGLTDWRGVLFVASGCGVVGALLAAFVVRPGPFDPGRARFDLRAAVRVLAHRPTRLANFGYLGHMWELYSMWTWAPLCLRASYEAAGMSPIAGRLAGFACVAAGGLGAVIAGVASDRIGRTTTTIVALVISGACCLVAGALFTAPVLLTILCIVWGIAVVADSAQFSAAVSELAEREYVGTALTLQTCLGFLLTLVTIRGTAAIEAQYGWTAAFAVLALGPAFGIWSMAVLKRMPEARAMAGGRR